MEKSLDAFVKDKITSLLKLVVHKFWKWVKDYPELNYGKQYLDQMACSSGSGL